MKLRIDSKADALYLRLDESAVVASVEVTSGVVLDIWRHKFRATE